MTLDNQLGVDILIITALAEEQQVLQQFFNTTQETHPSCTPLTFHRVTIESSEGNISYSIAITCLFAMGNPDAGILTTIAIQELNPTYIIMFGLAGGIKDRIDLGDVIVSTQIFYYERAKIHPEKIDIRPISFQVDPILKNRLADFVPKTSKTYKVVFGPIAAGEKVVADSKTMDDLKEFQPKLLGIEMESYGVALAASIALHRPRFIAIRGVSDHADENKDDDSRNEALVNATDYLIEFIETGTLPLLDESTTKELKTLISIHHLSLDRRLFLHRSIVDNIPRLQDYSIRKLEIDQTDLYQGGSLTNPTEAYERQREFGRKLDGFLEKYPDARIGYFAIAHIPLMFHLGYETNIREVQVFASNRQTRQWEALCDEDAEWSELIVDGVPPQPNSTIKEIIVIMSISYPIILDQVKDSIDISSIPIVHIKVEKPEPDLIIYKKQVDSYAKVFQQALVDIRKSFPKIENIRLFFSGPPTIAFRCGQQISKTVDPNVTVYNFSNKDIPNYGWALNIHSGEIIDLRETTQKELLRV